MALGDLITDSHTDETIWAETTMATLTMRKLSPEFIGRYLAAAGDEVLSSVGAYQIESLGIELFDKIRSVVEIDLNDASGGRTIVQAADDRYRGGPDKPFTSAELHEKFADCAQLTMNAGRIARAIEQIEAVDRLKDAGELVRTLA